MPMQERIGHCEERSNEAISSKDGMATPFGLAMPGKETSCVGISFLLQLTLRDLCVLCGENN